MTGPVACAACGGTERVFGPVLWPELVAEWGLSDEEAASIDRQQGCRCTACGANLRSMVLARAIVATAGGSGTLAAFVASPAAADLRILEINEAGSLTPILARAPGHRLRSWPDVDLQAIDEPDGSLDVVVHSDTLEHVPDPVRALRECRRVLRPGGFVAYTVPIVPDRLTRSRAGLPPSWHHVPEERGDDQLVQTEYGADAWRHPVQAGFDECRLFALEHPDAHALVGVRPG